MFRQIFELCVANLGIVILVCFLRVENTLAQANIRVFREDKIFLTTLGDFLPLPNSDCRRIPDKEPALLYIPPSRMFYTCEGQVLPPPSRTTMLSSILALCLHALDNIFSTNLVDNIHVTPWILVTGLEDSNTNTNCDIGTKLAKIQDAGYAGVLLGTNRPSKRLRQRFRFSKEKGSLELDVHLIHPDDAKKLVNEVDMKEEYKVFVQYSTIRNCASKWPSAMRKGKLLKLNEGLFNSIVLVILTIPTCAFLYKLFHLVNQPRKTGKSNQTRDGTKSSSTKGKARKKKSHSSSSSSRRERQNFQDDASQDDFKKYFSDFMDLILNQEHYLNVLNIQEPDLRTMTVDNLNKIYKNVALREHPDKHQHNDEELQRRQTEKFQEVKAATDFLVKFCVDFTSNSNSFA